MSKYFLPYQLRWLKDKSKIKISEKSRRIGMTYAQSYEDVQDCVKGVVPSVWFSSADDSAAKEYIEYCKKWAGVYKVAFEAIEEKIVDNETTHVIRFANGTKITALASNPKGFRSKGGKVVLDEFAFHDNPQDMWAAARPVITWGFPLRILSTYNGKSNLYYRFIEDIKKGTLSWSLHTTTIYDAVSEGLLDKIVGRKTTLEEQRAWIEEIRRDSRDENTFLQEYCCIPIDETTAFLTYDLIESVEAENFEGAGDLFVGVDIGRKKDLTVIWLLTKVADMKYTKEVIELQKAPFRRQREVLFEVLKSPSLRRCAIDATGLGMQLAEEAVEEFGKYRVEAVTFSGKVKEELAFSLKNSIEDKRITIPAAKEIREDLHSVKKVVGLSGNIRFDAERSETDGHADRFWALALANYAATDISGEVFAESRNSRNTKKLLQGY